ncbi:MAG TPA: MFS transporter, partial [Clostridium sp.]|uniref:MFS transporter n=1 Tax=Clostridium sp. TaxID=1506 RepID=UPI002F959E0B
MDKHEERYMWVALTVVIVGTFMAILDSSIVNVAIPKLMTIFKVSTDQIEWILTGYMLTMSIVIPFTGYLGDRFGIKKLYIFALTVFTIGSALCGLSTSIDTMIAARVVQAIGGGMIMPVGMAMIYQIVPLEKRGLALGVWGISAMAAPAIGPTLSGYIIQ